MSPRVSIVVPAFNAELTVVRSLTSVVAQTCADIEIIVVDDYSRDATREKAESYLATTAVPYKVIGLEKNSGPSVARNVGVRNAVGEYIAFLDADDIWLPRKLELQIALMDENPHVRVCGCQAQWLDESGRIISLLYEKRPVIMPDGWKTLLSDCFIATPCAVVRRRDLGIHPFDETLRVGEDRDLWIRLASNGSVALVPDVMAQITLSGTSYMSQHKDLISVDTKPMIEGHIRAFSDVLSIWERWRAYGKLYSDIGKGLIDTQRDLPSGRRHLFLALLHGYRPWDSLRFLALTAPGIRQMKDAVKKLPLTRQKLANS
tara:strand:+ start:154 stop:1107 length:954 start_codon:yes stop_codon:yes gene_type:complete